MRLDRNVNEAGDGKYALLNMRKLDFKYNLKQNGELIGPGVCDFCENTVEQLIALKGSRTSAGFCSCLECSKESHANKVNRLIEAIKANPDAVEFGEINSENEFFVIKLRDINSTTALIGYAASAEDTDHDFAQEVLNLSKRSGNNNPHCKIPD